MNSWCVPSWHHADHWPHHTPSMSNTAQTKVWRCYAKRESMHGDGKAYRIDGNSKVQNWIKIKSIYEYRHWRDAGRLILTQFCPDWPIYIINVSCKHPQAQLTADNIEINTTFPVTSSCTTFVSWTINAKRDYFTSTNL